MGVHGSGDGDTWDVNENIDADQPHGLDYRQFNHLAVGLRKRLAQEHTTFADSTVGGIHKPGGSAVLGMEITDTAVDPTDLVVADGTYRGHGIIWAYDDASNSGTLWCATAAAGASTTGDWTIMKLHPDDQWGGGDITWAGAHQFDATVSIVGDVSMDGDLAIGGDFSVDGSSDFAGAMVVGGDLSVAGSVKIATDFSLTGGMAIDGTENHNDEADFSAVNIDGTTSMFVGCTSQSAGAVDLSHGAAFDATWQVDSDGFINVYATAGGNTQGIKILIGSAANVTKVIDGDFQSTNGLGMACGAPIPQGWYFAVSATANADVQQILWTAIGKGSCVSLT